MRTRVYYRDHIFILLVVLFGKIIKILISDMQWHVMLYLELCIFKNRHLPEPEILFFNF